MIENWKCVDVFDKTDKDGTFVFVMENSKQKRINQKFRLFNNGELNNEAHTAYSLFVRILSKKRQETELTYGDVIGRVMGASAEEVKYTVNNEEITYLRLSGWRESWGL